MSWQHARVVAHPITRYVNRAEAAYSAFQLLFGVLLLAVVVIPRPQLSADWLSWCCAPHCPAESSPTAAARARA